VDLSEELRLGLDMAINEADFCDMRINERIGEVQLLLVALTLPATGPEPADRRRLLCCKNVRRIVASLRHGPLHDGHARIAALRLTELPATVRSFGCQPVYGWEFLDAPGDCRPAWNKLASIDELVRKGTGEHSLDLFQEGVGTDTRRLDLRVEFDELSVVGPDGAEITLEEFASGGRRWWTAFESGDPRTAGHGLSRPSR
jgi:hypothetical protein